MAVNVGGEVQAEGAVEADAFVHALGVQDDQRHPDPRQVGVHVLIRPVPRRRGARG